jgi:hypothetical protein
MSLPNSIDRLPHAALAWRGSAKHGAGNRLASIARRRAIGSRQPSVSRTPFCAG